MGSSVLQPLAYSRLLGFAHHQNQMPKTHTQTAERLQVALGVQGNGINPARRNKYLTNLALKARGAGERVDGGVDCKGWDGMGGQAYTPY